MDPITTSGFEQDPTLPVVEQSDGSAFVEVTEVVEPQPTDHFANLAETLDRYQLNTIAAQFFDLIEKDKEARKKRDEQYAEGIRRTGLGDEAPGGAQFSGASRAVHPVLAEACVDFAARAIKELFPPNGPVKIKVVGEKSSRDVLERARRKRDYLNWLLTTKMRNYRDEKEVLLTQLPLGGSQYEKYYVDPETGSYVMEFVPIDMVLLPFSTSSFRTASRITHVLDLTRVEFERRVRSGLYKDIDNLLTDTLPEGTNSSEATDKIEGRDATAYNEDGLRRLYEVSCSLDIEDFGVAPYIMTLDESSGEVVAIYRNWREDDPSRQRLDWWVENKFIPWRGVYGIGLPHLIGSLSGALTGALRALLDAAHINNSPGAVKLKGGRVSGQNIQIEQTQIVELDAPPGVQDIRQIIMPLPFNPPSPVLAQLLEWLTAQAKGVVAVAEEKIADAGNNMPVGTALALIEQGSQVFSSIHARLHESQRRALEIICRLVHDYPNQEELDRFELTIDDFKENDDVVPVSDPRIFSEAQRFAQLQEQLKLMATLPQLPWKWDEVARRALELLRVDNIDALLPPVTPEVSSDPVTENFMAATTGATLKVLPEQDHVAHISAHLSFILDPLYGAGPAISGPMLQKILVNIQDHMMQIYLGAAKAAAAIHALNTGDTTETAMTSGSQFALRQLQEVMPDFVQQLQQAAEVVQKKMPQQPIDPAVQKTFEASMAEINRKAQESQARLQLEAQKFQAELQLKQSEANSQSQLEQSRLALDSRLAEMGNVIRLQIAAIQEEGRKAAEEMRQQVELLKNQQDNEQHQTTELLKNYQDNVTSLQATVMRLSEQVDTKLRAGVDLTPQIDQLNAVLAKLEQQKTQDALTTVMEGLRATIDSLNRPKMIIEDENGKPVGIR